MILRWLSWWIWYKNKIIRAGVSNCKCPCLNFFGTKCTHFCIPGLKEKALFLYFQVFFLFSSYHTYINLYKYCEMPNFYFRSFLNVHSALLALFSPMWHCVTLILVPKFRYLDKKMYLSRWLFSLPSLPLGVPPCDNSSEVHPTHIKPFPLVSFTHEQLTWKNQLVWIRTIKVSSSSCYLLICLYKLKHKKLFNHHLL